MNSKYLNQNIIDEIIDEDRADESNVRAATDSHQAEFPYDRDQEGQVTRREFCNFLFLTSTALMAGAAGYAGVSLLEAREEPQYEGLKIEGAEKLAPGQSLNFRFPTERDPAILVRTTDGEYHAYDQKCTHLSCPVYYSKEKDHLECPCHDGGFDARTGRNIFGPPPRPLPRIKLEKGANGEIRATGIIYGGGSEHAAIESKCKRERRA